MSDRRFKIKVHLAQGYIFRAHNFSPEEIDNIKKLVMYSDDRLILADGNKTTIIPIRNILAIETEEYQGDDNDLA